MLLVGLTNIFAGKKKDASVKRNANTSQRRGRHRQEDKQGALELKTFAQRAPRPPLGTKNVRSGV